MCVGAFDLVCLHIYFGETPSLGVHVSEEVFHVYQSIWFSLELCTTNITKIKNITPGTQHFGFGG